MDVSVVAAIVDRGSLSAATSDKTGITDPSHNSYNPSASEFS